MEVRFIDLDWGGRTATLTYPPFLADHAWALTDPTEEPILQAHDALMMERTLADVRARLGVPSPGGGGNGGRGGGGRSQGWSGPLPQHRALGRDVHCLSLPTCPPRLDGGRPPSPSFPNPIRPRPPPLLACPPSSS